MSSKWIKGGKAAWSALTGGSRVSPTISSVKPNLKKTIQQSRSDEYRKRSKKLRSATDKVETGKKMMKEGQKERKRMTETGTAFRFSKSSKSYHAIEPGDVQRYKIKKGIARGD
jgi:hypothetical protein